MDRIGLTYSTTRIDDALDRLYFPMGEVDDETVVNMIDQNDEEEEYINPEEELLDENDVIVLEEQQTLDFVGATTSNN